MDALRHARRCSQRVRSCAAATALGLLGLATVAAPLDARPTHPTQIAHAAQPPQTPPSIPDGGRFLEPVFDDVEITEDIPYRDTVDFQGNPQTLLLDIYEPAGDTAPMRPVVIFMHGGVFVTGDKDQIFGVGEWLASRGYVVVSNQYRLRPNLSGEIDADLIDAIIDAYDDSLAAVNWVRDHAVERRLDPRAIIAGGVSAGAVNAWNLAYFQGSPARPEPSSIAAAVSISGATIGVPSPGDPPVIAFHGTADNIVPFGLAEASCTTAVAIGLRCELVAYEGGDHFVGLQQTDDIQRRTLDFLAKEVLLPLGYFGELEPAAAGPVVREPAFTG